MVIWRNLSGRTLARCLAAMAPRPAPEGKPPAASIVRGPVASPVPQNENAG